MLGEIVESIIRFIVGFLLDLIVDIVFDGVFYSIGYPVVKILTFGMLPKSYKDNDQTTDSFVSTVGSITIFLVMLYCFILFYDK